MRRRRWRLLVPTGLVLLAAGGAGWWYLANDSLTAEEQAVVGWWTTGGPPQPGPAVVEALEYRKDRTIRARVVDTRTGEVWFEDREVRWRAAGGLLVYVLPRGALPLVRLFQGAHEFPHRASWGSPDRYRAEPVETPRGTAARTVVKTRWTPPGP